MMTGGVICQDYELGLKLRYKGKPLLRGLSGISRIM